MTSTTSPHPQQQQLDELLLPLVGKTVTVIERYSTVFGIPYRNATLNRNSAGKYYAVTAGANGSLQLLSDAIYTIEEKDGRTTIEMTKRRGGVQIVDYRQFK